MRWPWKRRPGGDERFLPVDEIPDQPEIDRSPATSDLLEDHLRVESIAKTRRLQRHTGRPSSLRMMHAVTIQLTNTEVDALRHVPVERIPPDAVARILRRMASSIRASAGAVRPPPADPGARSAPAPGAAHDGNQGRSGPLSRPRGRR